jgi:hypothetical protein
VIDLDDTENCPVAQACQICSNTEEIEVATVSSVMGVFCLTICEACIRFMEAQLMEPPLFPVAIAARWSLEHCGHLGITVDQMAEAMS